jgi:GT2 family glycosyltransferase
VWYAGGTLSLVRGLGRHVGEGERDAGVDERMRPVAVTFITGCCMLLTRDALDAVGAFEDAFFAYGEDVDLSFRLTRAGFALLHEPRARLWHRVPPQRVDPTPFQIEQRDRNRRRFVKLRLSMIRRALFCIWFYPTRVAHLVRYVLRGDRARAAAILRGALA